MSEPIDIEAIRARADAATPGPWRPGHKYYEQSIVCFHGAYAGPYRGEVLREGEERVLLGLNGGFEPRGDVAFIAHARTDIPALCDALEHERKVSAAWKALAEALNQDCSCGGRRSDPICARCERADARVADLRAIGIDPEAP